MKRLIALLMLLALLPMLTSCSSSSKSDVHKSTGYTYYLPVFLQPPHYWSGLGITNLSASSPANVTVTIYNNFGIVLETVKKTIPAKGQDSFIVGSKLKERGSIKITSDQPLAGLNFLGRYIGSTKNYYLADVPFTDIVSKSLIIPHVSQNSVWDTTIYIASTESSSGNVTLTYINKAGVATTPYVVPMSANQSRYISVSNIGKSDNIKGGYVTITSNRNLTAFALYKNLKTGNYSYAGINAVDNSVAAAKYDYYLPVFLQPPHYWSGLGITNLSASSPANVTVTIYNNFGIVLETVKKTIPAKGQDSFIVGSKLKERGSIKITSDQPLAGLNFLGRYIGSTKNYYLADVPFTDIVSKSLIIPHVSQNSVWDTTIYIASTESSSGNVTLTYINKAGVATTPYVVPMSANQSRYISVSNIGKSDNIKGGYVTITSNRNLTAFALYKNLKTGNYSYAGINACPYPSKLEEDITYYMDMLSSLDDFTPMIDEIGTLLEAILNDESSVVTIVPKDIDFENLPSSIKITADFGKGYTPSGSKSVYTGKIVINITNLSFTETLIKANVAMTATNVKRDGQLILNGGMTLGVNVAIAGDNVSVTANCKFSNLQSLDFKVNGGAVVSIPKMNLSDGNLSKPIMITFDKFSTRLDFQVSGTAKLTQTGANYDALLNLTSSRGAIVGTVRFNNTNPDRIVISTPTGDLKAGNYFLDINNVIVDPDKCSGNLVAVILSPKMGH